MSASWIRIAALMHAKGWSKADLARHAGVSPSAIQKWEAGGKITLESAARIATALGVAPSDVGDPERHDPAVSSAIQLALPKADPREGRSDLRIGSVIAPENPAYRAVSDQWLLERVTGLAEALPGAPAGRGRLHVIRTMLEMLLEMQERAVDAWTGKRRDDRMAERMELRDAAPSDAPTPEK